MSLPTPPIPIETAQRTDAADILALQKLAYQSEAELNQDFTIPPLTQTLAELERDFERQTFLKAVCAGRLIGSVRGYAQAGVGHIGRIIVHPDFQNRGLGTRLLQAIEQRFPAVQRYALFTSARSQRNLYLYQKLGYSIVRQEQLSERVLLVFLEKPNHV